MKFFLFCLLIPVFFMSCTTIHSSARKGDIESVKIFLEKGANVDVKDKKGKTPLMLAVQSNKYELVEHLVSKGADVNAKDNEGYTPLMYLKYPMVYIYAVNDLQSFAEASGLYSRIKDHEGYQCLDKDCRNTIITISDEYTNRDAAKEEVLKGIKKLPEMTKGIIKIAAFLIEKGADVNAEAKDFDTILNYSAALEVIELTELLLKNNANADRLFENIKKKTTNQPRFPCDIGELLQKHIKSAKVNFCERNYTCTDLISYCMDSVDINSVERGKTLLMSAAESGRIDLIEMIIERKADPDFEADYGWTALSLAIENNQKEAVAKLLDAGANINYVNKYGETPIIDALTVKKPNVDIIVLLVKKGADIKYKVNNKSSDYNSMTVSEIAKKKGVTITIN